MTSVAKIADIYIRESKDELAAGYSPEVMIAKCRLLVAELGAEVGREVVEVGKRDEYNCPELIEEIRRAKAGEIDFLVSYDILRLSGDPGKHGWLKDHLDKTRCRIRYTEVEYADTAEGELMEGVQGEVGRFERRKTRERTQNGITGKLVGGEPICGGRTPYGLERVYRGLKPIGWKRGPALAVLERIVDELATDTLATVCTRLNAEGVLTPTGKGHWRSSTILSLLDNKVYVGLYEFGVLKFTPTRNEAGERRHIRELHPEEHVRRLRFAPFIDPEAIGRARAAMARRKLSPRGRLAAAVDPFTLRGRLRCAHCGGALSCTKNNGVRYYICLRAYPHNPTSLPVGTVRCPMKLVPAAQIEAWAWERMAEALGDRERVVGAIEQACEADGAAERHREQVASVTAGIARLEGRIARAGEELLEVPRESESAQSLRETRARAERELAGLRESLGSLERQAPVVLDRADADRMLDEIEAIVEGLSVAGELPQEQRELYALFRVTGTVGMDPEGMAWGATHRFGVRFEGLVSLLGGGQMPWGISLRWNSHPAPPTLTFERAS